MQKCGRIGVDMDLSTLLALAEFRKINFVEFLIGEDSAVQCDRLPLERHNQKILDATVEILNHM